MFLIFLYTIITYNYNFHNLIIIIVFVHLHFPFNRIRMKLIEVLVILQKKRLVNYGLEMIWRKTEMWSTVCCQLFCKNKKNY